MQKAPKILNYKNLMFEKYEYLQPHKTNSGNYISICNYKLSKNELLPYLIETPKMRLASGIINIDNKYYIDLEISQTNEVGLFYDFLLKNDEHNIDICHCNSKDWFGQTMPLQVIQNFYKSPVILRSNGLLPIIRVRLPSYKGNILTELYNVRKERIDDLTMICEGDYIMGIVEFVGLSFGTQIFSPCYEMQKIKIYKDNENRNMPSGYLFSDINEKIETVMIEEDIKPKKIIIDQEIKDIPEPKPIIEENKMETKDNQIFANKKEKTIEKEFNSKLNNGKTLLEMIKSTTLKDILSDDDIFLNNNKLITQLKNVSKPKPIFNKPIAILKEEIKLFEPIKTTGILKEEIQIPISPVNKLDLDIDFDINNSGDGIDLQGNVQDNDQDNDQYNEQIYNENSQSDDENDFDINYDSLNDLEVIVFEE